MRGLAVIFLAGLAIPFTSACKNAAPLGCPRLLTEPASAPLLFSGVEFPLEGLEFALYTPLSSRESVEDLWRKNPILGEVPKIDFAKEQVVIVGVTTRTCADYDEVMGFFMGRGGNVVVHIDWYEFCSQCDTASDPFYDVYRVPQGTLSECRVKTEECD